jgi:hypothetical protein
MLPATDLLDCAQMGSDHEIVKVLLVNAIRAILQYKGVLQGIWTDPAVADAIVPILGLLGVKRIQADSIAPAGVAIGHRLWYMSLNDAVDALGTLSMRRTVGTRASLLKRVLTQLGADAGLSPEETMHKLVSEANVVVADSVGYHPQ